MRKQKKPVVPTAERIISLNRLIIDSSPINEIHSVLNMGSVEFIADRVSGMENIWDIAARLLMDLIDAHAFAEGNKRTALLAMETFLSQNGHNFNIDKDELYFVYRIAGYGDKPKFEEIRQWIKDHGGKK